MMNEPKHKLYGRPMSEFIALTPSGLNDDIGVGLDGIIWNGKHGFGLQGAALIDFVRRSLYTLVERGAKPRHWKLTGNIPLHYGNDSPEEIIEGVIADWQNSGGDDLEWGDFRFTLPKYDALLNKTQLERR
jgi:hypothetical protein